jgi:STE24 endopeptidase
LSHRTLARFALGAAAGITIGYTALRARDMLADQASPAQAKERDAKRYGDARRVLMVAGHVRAAASGAMWAFGLADVFERGLGWVPVPLRLPVFVGLLTTIEAAREWPIEYVEEYQLERIFGNSERTMEAWAGERVKALAVGGGVGVVLSGFAGLLMRRAPKRWPWIAIAGMPALLAFANVVAPTFIMPLFNKYIPLEGPLEARIRELAARYGVGGAMILRFDMSRQSKKANAFVTGVFGTERIAIADTLLDEFPDDETLFVVAHELGHYVKRDPWVSIALGTALTALPMLAANAIVRRATDRGEGPVSTGMRIGFYLFVGQLLSLPIANAFSRAIERRADRFAVAATNDPPSGARAFRRLRDQNLAEDEGPMWSELLFSSHPSLGSRIAALERACAEPVEASM